MKNRDFNAIVQNWKTTLLGFIPLLAGVLTLAGVFTVTPEQQQAVADGVNLLADTTISVKDQVTAVIEMVIGIGLIFSRDANKSSQDSGIR